MKKIVFVISQLSQPRCIKRVKAFSDAGYEVEVFGFDNGLYSKNISLYPCEIHRTQINGIVSKFKSIHQNISLIKNAGKSLKKGDLMYIFGIEMAVYYRLFGRRNAFIYEQADLNYTKLNNKGLVSIFKRIDKHLISKSYKTVLTSQGFIDYLYKQRETPSNIVLLENRLNKDLKTVTVKEHSFNPQALRFAFIGAVRYPNTILTFARVVAEHYPNHQFHFYGEGLYSEQAKELCERYSKNLFYHGGFSNPKDLPEIYSKVDVNIVCYDTTSMNVRIAEPNKLYESCFFKVPLVVSSSTFLEKKVLGMKVGYSIDCTDEKSIISFINGLNHKSLKNCINAMEAIPQRSLFDNTDELIYSIEN